MKPSKSLFSLILLVLLSFSFTRLNSQELTSPEKYFGFSPGANRKLFDYSQLIDYLLRLEKESSMIKMVKKENTPLGQPMYVAFISSEKNIRELDMLKEINRRLALDGDIPGQEKSELISGGKVFVMLTLSMHANEVGPSQAAPLIAYNLVNGQNDDIQQYLDDVVIMMVPCHNPDGMNMVVNHYNNSLGTPYEGSSLPGVYHKYVGHNVNRDFITLSQIENQVVADLYNLEWHPQVLVEKHQMGMTGPRYFVPPSHDPIAEIIDETLWNWTWIFGSGMSRDMTEKGLEGISQNYLFDDYWPGSTQTSMWKNIISLLTEAAGAQLATPVYIEANELQVGGKGLSEYKKSIRMPAPWPGGWWQLADIVQYEVESTYSLLKSASLWKKEILSWRNEMARKEIEKGKSQPPFYYILPRNQHDQGELSKLVRLLERHGVSVYKAENDIMPGDLKIYPGDVVIPLSQPFRPFIKEVMESQKFPLRHYTPDGEKIMPYDITSWSLPLHRGINSYEVNEYYSEIDNNIQTTTSEELFPPIVIPPAKYLVFPANNNESYLVAFSFLSDGLKVERNEEKVSFSGISIEKGSFLIEATRKNIKAIEDLAHKLSIAPSGLMEKPEGDFRELKMPAIAIAEHWMHDMDAGWTRFLFDQYSIPYTVVRPEQLKENSLSENFDVLIFPDASKDQLMHGHYKRNGEVYVPYYPQDYTKGMEKEGWQNVLDFIDQGGKILSWGRSVELFYGLMQAREPQPAFRFPVDDAAKQIKEKGFAAPGSFFRINLKPDHPVNYGMPAQTGVFQRGEPLMRTSIPVFGMDRRVIGMFPDKDILLSGYAEKVETLENIPAMVWIKKGKGQLLLFSFTPNFRGSTPVTNKLIFNGLLLQ